eukprot:CAMPEP_0171280254 /NCGR_PEP_ID=MMETSP0790-20130122/65803_1 /TAXON_ID=2925 /ORGANISM="Alexandrium catenella, Strain OF101" /LENGTH=82 /DNA_ID=CAMNT_0011749463 /DNA_START=26 /DNA_END=271 /DNA_ORIENTATION=+
MSMGELRAAMPARPLPPPVRAARAHKWPPLEWPNKKILEASTWCRRPQLRSQATAELMSSTISWTGLLGYCPYPTTAVANPR